MKISVEKYSREEFSCDDGLVVKAASKGTQSFNSINRKKVELAYSNSTSYDEYSVTWKFGRNGHPFRYIIVKRKDKKIFGVKNNLK